MTDPEPLITADAVRASVSGLTDTVKYDDATLERFVSRFEDLVANYRGVPATPRSFTETVQVRRGHPIIPRWPHIQSVTAFTYDSGATAPVVDDLLIRDGWAIWPAPATSWCGGDQWVTITYVAGYDPAPAALVDACIEFVKCEAQAQKSAAPRSASTRTDEATGYTYTEVQADPSAGRPTKWAPVNNALNEVPDERTMGFG